MLSDLRYRLRAIVRRKAVERELDEELRFHLDEQAAAGERAGLSRGEAARRAQLLFGGVDRAKEESREGRGVFLLETVLRDLRYAIRTLARSPGFTLVALVSLTLGIGANTAMFQLLNALALRPLPIAHPEELAEVRLLDADLAAARGNFNRYPSLTNPLWERIRDRQEAFSGMFAWSDASFNLAPAGEVRFARGLWVSGGFFPVLGVEPVAGRLFAPADDRRGCALSGAVISYDFWQREFAGDPAIIGRTLRLSARRVEVIGVTPARFRGVSVGQSFDVALPICAIAAMYPNGDPLDSGTTWWLTIMGRLKPGWNVERANAHLRVASSGIFAASLPSNYPAVSVKAYLASTLTTLPAGTGISWLREVYASPLAVLMAMTGLVLLMACFNLTNLTLARGAVRRRELALRLALGGSRARLMSQLLTESLLIALLSAGAGVLVAHALSQLLIALLSTSGNPIVLSLSPDWRVLAFTSATAGVTCLILGLTPAVRATRGSPGDVLKADGRSLTGDHESLGLRRALVVAQVAVSLVLVLGALLFVRSFRNLVSVPLGFERHGVLIVRAGVPPPAPSAEVAEAMKRDLLVRLRSLPGVSGVAETNLVPLSGGVTDNAVWMDGADRASGQSSLFSRVSSGYFQTLGMALVAGRDIGERDTAAAPKVAVVNESFARAFTRGASPVGARFWIEATPTNPETVYEIVGLVRDAKYRTLREAPGPVAFLALAQQPSGPDGTFLIRSTSSVEALVPMVRRTLLEVNGNMRFAFRVLDTEIRDTLMRDRVMATLSGLFGLLAGVLAAVGLHGVVSYMVTRRRREIGIRLALGAGRSTIVAAVLRESGTLVAVGLGIGVVLSLALTRAARTLLFGLDPNDAATVLMAVAGLACIALLASYVPAHRAARLDPMTTLREE